MARKREAESKGRKGRERGTERRWKSNFTNFKTQPREPQPPCLLIGDQKGRDDKTEKKEERAEKEPAIEHLMDGRCIRCFHTGSLAEIWQLKKKILCIRKRRKSIRILTDVSDFESPFSILYNFSFF